MEPRDGEGRDTHLLAMRGARMGGAREHVDPVRDLVLAHGAVMRHTGEAHAEAAEREHAVEMPVGGDVML